MRNLRSKESTGSTSAPRKTRADNDTCVFIVCVDVVLGFIWSASNSKFRLSVAIAIGTDRSDIDAVIATTKRRGFRASTSKSGAAWNVTRPREGWMMEAKRDCFEALIGQEGVLVHAKATQADIPVYAPKK
jgi:hypothetical protein